MSIREWWPWMPPQVPTYTSGSTTGWSPAAPWLDWQPMSTFPRDGHGYLVWDARTLENFETVFWDDEVTNGWTLGTSDGPHYHPEAFTHWARVPGPQS
jgi:hypothetical protein